MKCGKKLDFNPKDIAEFILEIQYKLGAVVGDN